MNWPFGRLKMFSYDVLVVDGPIWVEHRHPSPFDRLEEPERRNQPANTPLLKVLEPRVSDVPWTPDFAHLGKAKAAESIAILWPGSSRFLPSTATRLHVVLAPWP
jgi:hypothetical protein